MVKKEVAELKKRLTPDKTGMQRVCGCYVNGEKEKLFTFNQNFLDVEEDTMPKYLDIAKKALGGKLGNNLIELEFPLEQEKDGGMQHSLMALRKTGLKNDEMVQGFYDKLIDEYDIAGNFLILLLYDVYDVPVKGKGGEDFDESEIVYESIIGAICPVELTKPVLGFNTEEEKIALLDGFWNVKVPETAFLFPTFTDRSADIHSLLMYTKDTKAPHYEFMDAIMNCPTKETEDLVRDSFNTIVTDELKNVANDNEVEDLLLEVHQGLADYMAEKQATYADSADFDLIELTSDVLAEILGEVNINEDVIDKIVTEYGKSLEEKQVYVSRLVDEKLLKKEELKIENIRLRRQIKALTKKAE